MTLLTLTGLNRLLCTKKGCDSAPHRTAYEAAQLNADNIAGKLFVITGAYGGIGSETTKAILGMGGKVVIGGRSSDKVTEFVNQLSLEFKGEKIDGFTLDLADFESVQSFAKNVQDLYPDEEIHCLINNAGIIAPVAETKQGLELQMGTNVVGHFLLSKLLLSKTRRQVWLTSTSHMAEGSPRVDMAYYRNWSLENKAATYDFWHSYQQSKLGNILVAKEFHRRYPKLETASCHPGIVYTDMGKHLYAEWFDVVKDFVLDLPFVIATEGWWNPVKSAVEGASTTVTAASLPSSELVNGGYYKDCALSQESESAQNMDDAKALFDWCDEVTKAYQ